MRVWAARQPHRQSLFPRCLRRRISQRDNTVETRAQLILHNVPFYNLGIYSAHYMPEPVANVEIAGRRPIWLLWAFQGYQRPSKTREAISHSQAHNLPAPMLASALQKIWIIPGTSTPTRRKITGGKLEEARAGGTVTIVCSFPLNGCVAVAMYAIGAGSGGCTRLFFLFQAA